LSKEPNSGYGIQRLLRGTLGHLWEARLQQIYAELGRAEGEGLVGVQVIALPNRPAKKIYTLTPAGEDLLDAWLAGNSDSYVPKDDLLVKLYCLDRIPSDRLVRQVSDRRDRFRAEAERLERELDEVSRAEEAQLGVRLALEAALARAQAHVAWCRCALEVLEQTSAPVDAVAALSTA
jgi:DNA-binding PadR family transcriptional regulator